MRSDGNDAFRIVGTYCVQSTCPWHALYRPAFTVNVLLRAAHYTALHPLAMPSRPQSDWPHAMRGSEIASFSRRVSECVAMHGPPSPFQPMCEGFFAYGEVLNDEDVLGIIDRVAVCQSALCDSALATMPECLRIQGTWPWIDKFPVRFCAHRVLVFACRRY